jgi:hypothetical protein
VRLWERQLALQLLSLEFRESPIIAGASTQGVLTLNAPAPPGISVQLSSDLTIVTIPTQIQLAPGQTTQTLNITTRNDGHIDDRTATITATLAISRLPSTTQNRLRVNHSPSAAFDGLPAVG